MINPTTKNFGRSVVYKRGTRFMAEGVITSFNDSYVFVRYGADHGSQATRREDLEWV